MSGGERCDVIVVGAGAAGLAAAVALARDGKRVTLLERRPYVGGRAYSYEHPALAEVVDSQHVLLGCCTNLIELCAQAGISNKIRWYDEQTFLTPDGGVSTIATSGLPAPLHFGPSFLGARYAGAQGQAGHGARADGVLSRVSGDGRGERRAVAASGRGRRSGRSGTSGARSSWRR